MTVCYRKGKEQGLWYEIKCIEDAIAIKQKLNKDCKFEKGLLKAYRKFSEDEYAVSAKLANQNLGSFKVL